MANMTEIRVRIKSIQDTMKITNAMYLISSSKLKKAKKNLDATIPYFEALQSTIHDILKHAPDVEHEYFNERTEILPEHRKRGYIVVTGDKGLCGAYNHNVIKLAQKNLESFEGSSLFLIGEKGRKYFEHNNRLADVEFLYAAQNPSLHRARDMQELVTDLYQKKQLDEVYIVYTKMVTAMSCEPQMIQILPMHRKTFRQFSTNKVHHFAVFAPSPKEVLNYVVPNYVKGLIYGCLVEAFCSEQHSTLTAMESATSSAKDMIKELSLLYNRARQAAITQEINEVVGGVNAFKK